MKTRLVHERHIMILLNNESIFIRKAGSLLISNFGPLNLQAKYVIIKLKPVAGINSG